MHGANWVGIYTSYIRHAVGKVKIDVPAYDFSVFLLLLVS